MGSGEVCCAITAAAILSIYTLAYYLFATEITAGIAENVALLQADNEFFDKDKINQLRTDWASHPFTDIVVTEESSCPITHPDLVFYRTY